MVNYVCAFSQSEMKKYFEWIIKLIIDIWMAFLIKQIIIPLTLVGYEMINFNSQLGATHLICYLPSPIQRPLVK